MGFVSCFDGERFSSHHGDCSGFVFCDFFLLDAAAVDSCWKLNFF